MGVKQFKIEINNNPKRVFVLGQWIKGNVTLELGEKTKARAVVLSFVGEAKVHWEETQFNLGKEETKTKHYRNSESYFNQKTFLFGHGTSEGELHPAGEVVYPFKFQLPPNLPCSFEGLDGSIRYYIECRIKRPGSSDIWAKLPFTVNSVLDLNQHPGAREPRHKTNSKKLCCWCCKSGPITNTLSLDRSGYVPGECIVVNGEIVTYHSTSKRKVVKRYVAGYKQKSEIPKKGGSASWDNTFVPIPPLPPSDLIRCNIISLKYQVVLVASPVGLGFSFEVPCDITIGTIPMSNMPHIYTNGSPPIQHEKEEEEGAKGFDNPAMDSEPPVYSLTNGDPPPSYEESTVGKFSHRGEDGDETHTVGKIDFAPQYTYYSWNNKISESNDNAQRNHGAENDKAGDNNDEENNKLAWRSHDAIVSHIGYIL